MTVKIHVHCWCTTENGLLLCCNCPVVAENPFKNGLAPIVHMDLAVVEDL